MVAHCSTNAMVSLNFVPSYLQGRAFGQRFGCFHKVTNMVLGLRQVRLMCLKREGKSPIKSWGRCILVHAGPPTHLKKTTSFFPIMAPLQISTLMRLNGNRARFVGYWMANNLQHNHSGGVAAKLQPTKGFNRPKRKILTLGLHHSTSLFIWS